MRLNTEQQGGRVQRRKAGPLPRSAETSFAAPTPLFQASNRETEETYRGVVAALNSRLRVIAGSCGLQWIVQKRRNQLTWNSFAYCGTKEGLLLQIPKDGYGCDPEAWAAIEALPEYFPKKARLQQALMAAETNGEAGDDSPTH